MAVRIANGYTVAMIPSAPTTELTGNLSARVAGITLYNNSTVVAFVSFYPDGSALRESSDNGSFLSLSYNLSQLDAVLQMLREGVGKLRVSEDYIWRSDTAPIANEDRLLRQIEEEQSTLRELEEVQCREQSDFSADEL